MNRQGDTHFPLTGHVAGSYLVYQLKGLYQQLRAEDLARLEQVYTADVEFHDPVHALNGCLALRTYLRKLITNVTLYRLRYISEVLDYNAAYLTWEMDYAHPRIAGGRTITVRGMSHVKFTDRIYYHEDSYDLGAMLYEHLPVLGLPVRKIKQRLGG